MKKIIYVTLGFFMIMGALEAKEQKVVMITQIAQHPALDAVFQGARDYLRENGFDEKALSIILESAQGSTTLAAQIAQKFAGEAPEAIVAISTPSAQTVAKAVRGQIPVVFGAITDPTSAKLVKDPARPDGNITGVTDLPDFEDQIVFIQEVMPNLKTLGLLYNPGESNSAAAVEMVMAAAKKQNVDIVLQAVNRASDVGAATEALASQVDAMFVANDNTVATSLEAAIKVAIARKTPLFAADIMLVARGLPGMRGYDYVDQGAQVGKMVAQILQGKDVSDIPVEAPQKVRIILNIDAANKMGLALPKTLIKMANTRAAPEKLIKMSNIRVAS